VLLGLPSFYDNPRIAAGASHPLLPHLVFASAPGALDVAVPDWTFYDYPEARHGMPNASWATISEALRRASSHWRRKSSALYWRGSPTSSFRKTVVGAFAKQPPRSAELLVDVKFATVPWVPWTVQCQNKLLLHMAGHGPSLGLKYKFACNSTVLIPDEAELGEEFYYGALKAGVTHAAVAKRADGTLHPADVLAQAARLAADPTEARALARGGAQFAADFLSPQAIDYFWLAFVREHAGLSRNLDGACASSSPRWCGGAAARQAENGKHNSRRSSLRAAPRPPSCVHEIHIFITVCGDKPAPQDAQVVIRSIYETSTSAGEGRCAHVHVTHDGGSAVRKALLEPVRAMLRRGVLDGRRLRVTDSVTTGPERMKLDFKPCATARLFLGSEHPEVGTALYVDTDVYVQQDLSKLVALAGKFNGTQWCGMVAEAEAGANQNWYANSAYRKNMKPHERWFHPRGLNSGVMLLDLARWRETGFEAFAKAYRQEGPQGACCGDQDILNAYFEDHRDEMYVLPCKWNVRTDSACLSQLSGAAIVHGSRGALHKASSSRRRQQVPFAMLASWLGIPHI
jgi:lipopolysaccharide biosynthesis glycosyltransferase